ncbi:MAG: hypothetical protein M3Y05_00455 [Gemmatimonadota bacterium]|nr:hypothetical protein [Gemmatimonadota bacterium]
MDDALVVGGPRPLRGLFLRLHHLRTVAMPNTSLSESTEPIGIVISRGNRDEPTPAVFAYIWGAAPVLEAEIEAVRAPRAA